MILDKFSLKGKSGIVTGASQGLGTGIAQGVVQAGANVILASRSAERLEGFAEELRQYDTEVLVVPTDVTQKSDLEKLVQATFDAFGKIDFLFNNAGTNRRAASEEFTEEDWDLILNTNLKSVFLLSQLVARHMIRQGGGSIVNTGSLMCVSGGKTIPAYAASKGGVLQVTKALANDWAKYNIRVNAIGPGYFKTPLTEALRQDPVRNRELSERIPMGRWGEPEDLAGVAVFLASEASSYMTGQIVYVDGGWLSL